jgi:hypothetical protein
MVDLIDPADFDAETRARIARVYAPGDFVATIVFTREGVEFELNNDKGAIKNPIDKERTFQVVHVLRFIADKLEEEAT